MKNYITALLTVLLISGSVMAQPNQSRQDRIAAHKVSFITQKLQLSSEEAEKFWPVYNEYQEKLKKVSQATRKESRQKWSQLDNLSDAEIEELIKAYSDRKQSELYLFREYNDKFLAILPVRKVAELYLAEKQFKKEMLSKLRERKPPPPKK